MLLLKTPSNQASLVPLNRSIRASLNLVDPLASNGNSTRRKRHKIPSRGTLKGS
jgi:hypothetical protein